MAGLTDVKGIGWPERRRAGGVVQVSPGGGRNPSTEDGKGGAGVCRKRNCARVTEESEKANQQGIVTRLTHQR